MSVIYSVVRVIFRVAAIALRRPSFPLQLKAPKTVILSNKRSHSNPKHQKPSFSVISDRIPTQRTKNRHSQEQAIAFQPKAPKTVILRNKRSHSNSKHQKPSFSATSDRIPTQSTKNRHSQ
ncbi:MAG: hypothetical protein KME54_26905 [Tolypothrix brevis GSE-NOS-MK-07-07A]|jgi:hypothetical protein|nr:hypothetical protein [Tolypothrix brevis GSE-NOS-MK-07-07A]